MPLTRRQIHGSYCHRRCHTTADWPKRLRRRRRRLGAPGGVPQKPLLDRPQWSVTGSNGARPSNGLRQQTRRATRRALAGDMQVASPCNNEMLRRSRWAGATRFGYGVYGAGCRSEWQRFGLPKGARFESLRRGVFVEKCVYSHSIHRVRARCRFLFGAGCRTRSVSLEYSSSAGESSFEQ